MKGFKKVLLGTVAFGLISSAYAGSLAEIFAAGKNAHGLENFIGTGAVKYGGNAQAQLVEALFLGMEKISKGNISKVAKEISATVHAYDAQLAVILNKEGKDVTPTDWVYAMGKILAPLEKSKLNLTVAQILAQPATTKEALESSTLSNLSAVGLKGLRLEDIEADDLAMVNLSLKVLRNSSDPAVVAFKKEIVEFGGEENVLVKLAADVSPDRIGIFTDFTKEANAATKGQGTEAKVAWINKKLDTLAESAKKNNDEQVAANLAAFRAKNCYGLNR